METSKVKCRECKARATQYEGALPTRGVAKVLVAGFAIYILGLWVLVALAGFTTGDAAEVGMREARLLPPHPRHLPPIPKNPEKPFDRERRSVKLLTRC